MFATDHLGRRLPLLKAAWWVLRRPMFTMMFAGALFIHGAMQPEGTTIGSFLQAFLGGRTHCFFGPVFAVVDTGGVLSLVDGRTAPSSGTVVGSVLYRPRTRDTGFWAPTRHVIQNEPSIYWDAGEPTPAERRQVCTLLGAELATYGGGAYAAYAPILAAGGGNTGTPILSGYVQNLAALGLAAGLVLSLRWVPKLTMAQVEMNRRNQGLCGKCAYDLSGLASERCPECGYAPTNV